MNLTIKTEAQGAATVSWDIVPQAESYTLKIGNPDLSEIYVDTTLSATEYSLEIPFEDGTEFRVIISAESSDGEAVDEIDVLHIPHSNYVGEIDFIETSGSAATDSTLLDSLDGQDELSSGAAAGFQAQSFLANGNTQINYRNVLGGTGNVPAAHRIITPGRTRLRFPTGLRRAGYSFAGWFGAPDGVTARVFSPDEEVFFPNVGAMAMFFSAAWQATVVNNRNISFNAGCYFAQKKKSWEEKAGEINRKM